MSNKRFDFWADLANEFSLTEFLTLGQKQILRIVWDLLPWWRFASPNVARLYIWGVLELISEQLINIY